MYCSFNTKKALVNLRQQILFAQLLFGKIGGGLRSKSVFFMLVMVKSLIIVLRNNFILKNTPLVRKLINFLA